MPHDGLYPSNLFALVQINGIGVCRGSKIWERLALLSLGMTHGDPRKHATCDGMSKLIADGKRYTSIHGDPLQRLAPSLVSLKINKSDTNRLGTPIYDFLLVIKIMGLSRTVFEINGDFGLKKRKIFLRSV